jgi:hypothetical protein
MLFVNYYGRRLELFYVICILLRTTGLSVLFPQPNITTRNISSYSGMRTITTPTSFHPPTKKHRQRILLLRHKSRLLQRNFHGNPLLLQGGCGNIAAEGDSCATRHHGLLSCSPSTDKYRNVVTHARREKLARSRHLLNWKRCSSRWDLRSFRKSSSIFLCAQCNWRRLWKHFKSRKVVFSIEAKFCQEAKDYTTFFVKKSGFPD